MDIQRLGRTGVVKGLLALGTEPTGKIIVVMTGGGTAAIMTEETAMARTGESGTGTRSEIRTEGAIKAGWRNMMQRAGTGRGGAATHRSGAPQRQAVSSPGMHKQGRKKGGTVPYHVTTDWDAFCLCRDSNGKDDRRRLSDAEARQPTADPAMQPADEAAAPGVEFEVCIQML